MESLRKLQNQVCSWQYYNILTKVDVRILMAIGNRFEQIECLLPVTRYAFSILRHHTFWDIKNVINGKMQVCEHMGDILIDYQVDKWPLHPPWTLLVRTSFVPCENSSQLLCQS